MGDVLTFTPRPKPAAQIWGRWQAPRYGPAWRRRHRPPWTLQTASSPCSTAWMATRTMRTVATLSLAGRAGEP